MPKRTKGNRLPIKAAKRPQPALGCRQCKVRKALLAARSALALAYGGLDALTDGDCPDLPRIRDAFHLVTGALR